MIQILEGKGVGSGKSYQVCEMLIQHFRQGGTAFVSESFQIKWEELKALCIRRWGLHLEDDQFRAVAGKDIGTLHEKTSGGTDDCPVLIVIDEAQDQLNARDWSDKSKRPLFEWACQSRHDNNDLLFVSQSAMNIDKQIRRIATYTWSVRNLNSFPIPGLGKVGNIVRMLTFGMSHGIIFARTLLDYDGITSLERKFVVADRAIFNCYVSKSMRQSRKRLGEPIAKKKLKQEASKKTMLRIIIPVAVCMLVFGIYRVATHGIVPKSVAPSTQSSTASSHAATAPAAPQASVSPAYEIVRDKMLYRSGNSCKTAGGGLFILGEVSSLGMVTALKENTIRILKPDGGIVYVIAEDWTVPVVAVPAGSPKPEQKITVIAPLSAKESTLARNW